jgi:2,3-bisphosphoglycerate-independent phosphoglycerate mutase
MNGKNWALIFVYFNSFFVVWNNFNTFGLLHCFTIESTSTFLFLMNAPFKRAALLILDGWGHGTRPEASAIHLANTPFVDQLYQQYPHTELVTFGEEVGLPEGQMGNSEVGHLNIGAGRIVNQELVRINKAIRSGALKENPVLLAALEKAKTTNKALHLMGLLSDGGVHAHINHLKALCQIALDYGLTNIPIHAFLDGRDTGPNSGLEYLEDLLAFIEYTPIQLSSMIGRYYAMDRDQRWERIRLAYDLLIHNKGAAATDPIAALKEAYANGTTDEFVPALSCNEVAIQEEDVVLCYNYRTDRCRQITSALTQANSPALREGLIPVPLHYLTMTRYDEEFDGLHVLFEKENLKDTLGEVLARANKSQWRLAETEKYPHVTFFFSGGREAEFEGEQRFIEPSPKVATYDLQPEMSAVPLTNQLLQNLDKELVDFFVLNYANTDMVGHTGVMEAAIKAAETVDQCLARLIPVLLEKEYAVIIIADHGNSDCMVNEDGSPHTAHTTNMVPCFLVSNAPQTYRLQTGKLGDIAPTLLELLGLEQPTAMDGQSLLQQ